MEAAFGIVLVAQLNTVGAPIEYFIVYVFFSCVNNPMIRVRNICLHQGFPAFFSVLPLFVDWKPSFPPPQPSTTAT